MTLPFDGVFYKALVLEPPKIRHVLELHPIFQSEFPKGRLGNYIESRQDPKFRPHFVGFLKSCHELWNEPRNNVLAHNFFQKHLYRISERSVCTFDFRLAKICHKRFNTSHNYIEQPTNQYSAPQNHDVQSGK